MRKVRPKPDIYLFNTLVLTGAKIAQSTLYNITRSANVLKGIKKWPTRTISEGTITPRLYSCRLFAVSFYAGKDRSNKIGEGKPLDLPSTWG